MGGAMGEVAPRDPGVTPSRRPAAGRASAPPWEGASSRRQLAGPGGVSSSPQLAGLKRGVAWVACGGGDGGGGGGAGAGAGGGAGAGAGAGASAGAGTGTGADGGATTHAEEEEGKEEEPAPKRRAVAWVV